MADKCSLTGSKVIYVWDATVIATSRTSGTSGGEAEEFSPPPTLTFDPPMSLTRPQTLNKHSVVARRKRKIKLDCLHWSDRRNQFEPVFVHITRI